MRSFHTFKWDGVTLRVRASGRSSIEVLRRLREDYSAFPLSKETNEETIQVFLKDTVRQARVPWFHWSTLRFRAWGWFGARWIQYGETQVRNRRAKAGRVLVVGGGNLDALYEAAHMSLQSTIGEVLDRQGRHRVHSLGFGAGNGAWIFLLPSGGGKSTLAARLLQEPSIRLFSDEMPLLQRNRVQPFPVRMALDPQGPISVSAGRLFLRRIYPAKLLVAIPPERVAEPAPLAGILVKGSVGNRTHFIRLFLYVVVGWGLPQMAEHLLRADNLGELLRIFLSRLRLWLWMVRRVPVRSVPRTRELEKDARTLLGLVPVGIEPA